jgi:N utilization substance protein B
MKQRRRSREHALEALFYMDARRDFSLEALDHYSACFPPSEAARPFFRHLAEGVMRRRQELDRVIERFSDNWRVRRMAYVDRNVMRIAVYEMLYRDDIPAKVSINEAIDIGKKYGAEESGAFINGILDSAYLALERGELAPSAEPPPEIPARSHSSAPAVPAAADSTEELFSSVRGRPGVVKKRRSADRRPDAEKGAREEAPEAVSKEVP